jgi:hypothetical protein
VCGLLGRSDRPLVASGIGQQLVASGIGQQVADVLIGECLVDLVGKHGDLLTGFKLRDVDGFSSGMSVSELWSSVLITA